MDAVSAVMVLSDKAKDAARPRWHDYLLTEKGRNMKPEKEIKDVDYDADLACTYPSYDRGQDTKFLTYAGAMHLCDSFGKKDLDIRRPILRALLEAHIKPQQRPHNKRPRPGDSNDGLIEEAALERVSTLFKGVVAGVKMDIAAVGGAFKAGHDELKVGQSELKADINALRTDTKTGHGELKTDITSVGGAVDTLRADTKTGHGELKSMFKKIEKALADEIRAHAKTQHLLAKQQATTQRKQLSINMLITENTALKNQTSNRMIAMMDTLTKRQAESTKLIQEAVTTAVGQIKVSATDVAKQIKSSATDVSDQIKNSATDVMDHIEASALTRQGL